MNALLAIKDLSVEFKTEAGTIPAVKKISLAVNKGEIVAIVGESGSGKSVTALSILQLLPSPPARYINGKIAFYNDDATEIDLLKLSQEEMKDIRGNLIGMIFQEPMTSLNPVFTCGSQVEEAIVLH